MSPNCSLGKKQRAVQSPPAKPSVESPPASATTHLPSHRRRQCPGHRGPSGFSALTMVGRGTPLHQRPQWASWAAHSQSIFFSDDREKGKDTGLVSSTQMEANPNTSPELCPPLQRFTCALDIIILPFFKEHIINKYIAKKVLNFSCSVLNPR